MAKELLRSLEESFAQRIHIGIAEFGELLEFLALRRVQMRRHFDMNADVKIARAVPFHIANPFAFEPEHGAVLGPGWDSDLGLPSKGRDLDIRAQSSIDEADGHLAMRSSPSR